MLLAFALIAAVLMLAALLSGIVERAPLSFPMIFLGIGFLLGGSGLGVITITLHSPALDAIAVLSLSFVLFLDAVHLRFGEERVAGRSNPVGQRIEAILAVRNG